MSQTDEHAFEIYVEEIHAPRAGRDLEGMASGQAP